MFTNAKKCIMYFKYWLTYDKKKAYLNYNTQLSRVLLNPRGYV